MEKDIDKISKNPETDIVIRVDDFGGNVGVTIREFVRSERYTGFTKAGTRVPADKFAQFKKAINMIDEHQLAEAVKLAQAQKPAQASQEKLSTKSTTTDKTKSVKAKQPAVEENYDEMVM